MRAVNDMYLIYCEALGGEFSLLNRFSTDIKLLKCRSWYMGFIFIIVKFKKFDLHIKKKIGLFQKVGQSTLINMQLFMPTVSALSLENFCMQPN